MHQHSSTHEHEKYVGDDFQGHNIHTPREQSNYVPPPPYHNNNVPTRTPSHNVAAPWSTGLCHCFDDPANCFITCCCPCITFGQIAEIVNKGSSACDFDSRGALYTRAIIYGLLIFTGLPCLYSCFYRSKLRGQYDLEETPCVDCLVHCFCEPCALCQEHRQLQSIGFDMGIGWDANINRQRRGVVSTGAPVIAQSMSR